MSLAISLSRNQTSSRIGLHEADDVFEEDAFAAAAAANDNEVFAFADLKVDAAEDLLVTAQLLLHADEADAVEFELGSGVSHSGFRGGRLAGR